MAKVVNKVFVDKMGGRTATDYVGVKGDLFFDPGVGDLRIADGRPGGRPVVQKQLAPYRGFQAGCNQFLNSVRTNIVQVIIHNARGNVDYINYTDFTGSDDFYATNLSENQEDRATKVIALNLYSVPTGQWWTGQNPDNVLSADNITAFVRKFIDLVLYNDQDQPINNIYDAKNLFYANIDTLVGTLPEGVLFEDFSFDDGGRVAYPEYNATNNNTSANVKFIQWNSYPDGPAGEYFSTTEVVFRSSGTGYSLGDKITVNGGQLFGKDGENDLTMTVVGLKSGNITGLTMTSGGAGFAPHQRIGHSWGNWDSSFSTTSGNGYDAYIHIISCDENGTIQDYELTWDGINYQVGDTLTLNFGNSDATFEVTSVGTDAIAEWELQGTPYLGSPARVQNGYWPAFSIDDGSYDQYNDGNYISTEVSTSTYNVDIFGSKMTINGIVKEGAALQVGMRGIIQVPWEELPYTFTLVGQATDNSNVWYVDDYFEFSGVNVRFDAIPYASGNVVEESQQFNGGDYVVMFDKAVFAMMSFGANIDSLYYNGLMGGRYPWNGPFDKDGYKQIDVVFGAHGAPDSTIQIPTKRLWNSNYTLVTADAGRSLYYDNGGSNNVYIPNEGVTKFPLGTAITIVSGGDGPTYINATDGDITAVWGAGYNQTSGAWYIPANSMATIIKVAPEKWILSGAGLAID